MDSEPTNAAIALGSNLGDSEHILTEAVRVISQTEDIQLLAVSHLYQTAPVGPPQPDYLNACVTVKTTLSARSLLRHLLTIEQRFGRVRTVRWGARSLDLDLLLYGKAIIDSPGLTVPHPHLHQRPFVLVPLAEIAPCWHHPVLGQSIAQLLKPVATGPVVGVNRLENAPRFGDLLCANSMNVQ